MTYSRNKLIIELFRPEIS